MTSKKRVENRSSTDSSTGSSFESSSSSSSSGSDSCSTSDSESSSSQGTHNQQNVSEQKKTTPIIKAQRKSTETTGKQNTKIKPKPQPTKQIKQPPKPNIYSSDDDDQPPKPQIAAKITQKRKSNPKPKTSATVAVKSTHTASKHPPPKQKQMTGNPSHNAKSNKARSVKREDSKKKSIFSPENSSESDNNTAKLNAIKVQAKNSNQKPRTKASPRTVAKSKQDKTKVVEAKLPPKVKQPVSSASSISTSTDSSNTSDSDSSANSSASNNQNKITKTPTQKKLNKESNSESENELTSKQVTRKLTRSSSTRKSKHVLGKNVYSDTDSDTESTKRSLSRSPVKRAPVSSKGKTKNTKRNEAKSRASEIIIMEERKCPLEDCDSNGHLGGRQDKHFTIEACLTYHNVSPADTKEHYLDRKKREEMRKKMFESWKKMQRGQVTLEQKQNTQKIKEMRAKFKSENIDGPTSLDKNREPNLNNIVPDYDLKLFRDAQAIASEKIEEDLKSLPNTKGTKYIEMGKFEMEVWYQSPYPEDYARLPKLYICEFCLRYMKSRTVLLRHIVKCVWRHPPGEEVYRKDKISVWEVDGKRYKQYCQNLCLLAKFFLDHKTLYYDVEPFLFYVMTMSDSEGCHTVGYFSKEKNSFLNYNVSCILTLPPYQRQGYGRLLIDFSYLLTRVEGKIGSPEKPLSDLGLISYRSYWKDVLLGYLCSRAGTTLSVKDISQEMAIHSYDIVSTLQALGMMKYWKGKHIILKKQDVLDEYVERVKRRGSLLKEVDPSCLRWKPFVPPQPVPV
ncbi:hypothetical protein PPYR_12397 [Photinus pyralis]|uniref:Histone acetyltransferase n=1 Tax=Photinus pyralis TaxID=7054 RepID=A0A5N4AEA1_PHOPY|nr:histone acetyltransferase KAT7 [Photinus pyralis]KAB0795558.1 hypothetical protein PPYR_12397 [Photinus pyralis]